MNAFELSSIPARDWKESLTRMVSTLQEAGNTSSRRLQNNDDEAFLVASSLSGTNRKRAKSPVPGLPAQLFAERAEDETEHAPPHGVPAAVHSVRARAERQRVKEQERIRRSASSTLKRLGIRPSGGLREPTVLPASSSSPSQSSCSPSSVHSPSARESRTRESHTSATHTLDLRSSQRAARAAAKHAPQLTSAGVLQRDMEALLDELRAQQARHDALALERDELARGLSALDENVDAQERVLDTAAKMRGLVRVSVSTLSTTARFEPAASVASPRASSNDEHRLPDLQERLLDLQLAQRRLRKERREVAQQVVSLEGAPPLEAARLNADADFCDPLAVQTDVDRLQAQLVDQRKSQLELTTRATRQIEDLRARIASSQERFNVLSAESRRVRAEIEQCDSLRRSLGAKLGVLEKRVEEARAGGI